MWQILVESLTEGRRNASDSSPRKRWGLTAVPDLSSRLSNYIRGSKTGRARAFWPIGQECSETLSSSRRHPVVDYQNCYTSIIGKLVNILWKNYIKEYHAAIVELYFVTWERSFMIFWLEGNLTHIWINEWMKIQQSIFYFKNKTLIYPDR